MILPIIMLLSGILGGIVAQNKGRNLFLWTLLCGIMPLCVLILLALPTLPQYGVTRLCPHCLRIIAWQAKLCGYCGQRVFIPHKDECAFCGSDMTTDEQTCSSCGREKTNTQ